MEFPVRSSAQLPEESQRQPLLFFGVVSFVLLLSFTDFVVLAFFCDSCGNLAVRE